MRKKLEKRFTYLYSGEFTSFILFIFVSDLIHRAYPNLQLYSLYSFWASFLFLEFLLLQGAMYWYSKWKRLRNENTPITPIRTVRQLLRLKKMNMVLVIVPIMAFIADFVKWQPSLPAAGLTIAGCIYIFAVLEYVNYFFVQLSYDNSADIKYLLQTKKFKKACISKDFERYSSKVKK